MAPLYDEIVVISPTQQRFRALIEALDLDWKENALCRGVNPDRFFPETRGGTAEAASTKALCRVCPTRQPCLDYALTMNTKYGIWGGMTYGERREENKRRRLPPVSEEEVSTTIDGLIAIADKLGS